MCVCELVLSGVVVFTTARKLTMGSDQFIYSPEASQLCSCSRLQLWPYHALQESKRVWMDES